MANTTQDFFTQSAPLWTGTLGSGGMNDASVTTAPLDSASGLVNGEVYYYTIDRVNVQGVKTPTKKEVCKGLLSGTNFIDSLRGVEGTAQQHNAGAVVEILFTAAQWNDMNTGLKVGHNADGTHGSSFVTLTGTQTQTNKTLTSPVINTGVSGTAGVVTATSTQALTNKTLTSPLFQGTIDGWIAVTGSWAYASASTITVPSGAAALYQKGDRIRFKQGAGYKYFVITAVADTVLTVAVNTDFTVATPTAITDIYYSHQANPLGYPTWFNWTPSYTSGGGAFTNAPTTNLAIFSIIGNVFYWNLVFTYHATSGGSGNTQVTGWATFPATQYGYGGFGESTGVSAGIGLITTAGTMYLNKYDGLTIITNSKNISGAGFHQF